VAIPPALLGLAWGLIAQPLRADARAWFAALWRSWTSAVTPGQGDAWRPYPAALRAWSLCGVRRELVAGSGAEDCFIASLSIHAAFLRRHLETDAGGNHLVKNLKALAGLAVFFADEELLDQTLDRLIRQLAVQVLPESGHFERAPAYHCQVLGDLIDVDGLIRAAGRRAGPELAEAIQRMRRWLGCVLSPDGQVPLLNDGYPVDPALIGLLRPGTAPDNRLLVLPDTGLVRASAGGWRLLADVGPPCPDELPAHAHADTLSCLVHVDGAPLLVETGTSTYVPGPMRDYKRSTAAHNTVEIDGANSTEVWGTFRAARRARASKVMACGDGGELTAGAAHDGFRRLPGRPVHHRRWTPSGTGLRVDDLVSGTDEHSVTVRWYLAPRSAARLDAGRATASTPAGDFQMAVSASHPVALRASTAPGGHWVRPDRRSPRCWSTASARHCPYGSPRSGAGPEISSRCRPVSRRSPLREPREADRATARRGPGGGTGRTAPGPGPYRGAGPHGRVGDLPGTERAVTALAQAHASLLAKARARPDLVRQVARKARADGLAATRQAVRDRLAEDLPLGYELHYFLR
jgi:Heparinase II/III-like protein/Heparinase II/III N-terminus